MKIKHLLLGTLLTILVTGGITYAAQTVIPIFSGGTNSGSTPTTNALMYFNGTAIVATTGPLYIPNLVVSTNATFTNATATTKFYALRATVDSASTTNLSAAVFCLTGDSCRTTWPSGGTGSSQWATTSNLISIYPAGATGVIIGGTATTVNTTLEVNGTSTGRTLVADSTTASSSIVNALQIGSGTAGNNALRIIASKDYSGSVTVGGLFNLTNTLNAGAGAVITTNHAGSATGRLVAINCQNSAFDQDCVHIDSTGTADGLSITGSANGSNAASLTNAGLDHTLIVAYTGSSVNKGAASFTSTNAYTTFNVTGSPSGQGIVKISSSGVGDTDASGLSIDTSLSSFVGQGFFLKGNATGKLLNVRTSANTEVLTMLPSGYLGHASDTPTYLISANSGSSAFSVDTAGVATTSQLCLGSDGCRTTWPTAGTGTQVSTSTTANTNYSTTTAINLTANKIFDMDIDIGTTTPLDFVHTIHAFILFNGSRLDDVVTCNVINGAATACVTAKYGDISIGTVGNFPRNLHLTIDNLTNHYHSLQFQAMGGNVQTATGTPASLTNGTMMWTTTTPITSIGIGLIDASDGTNLTMSSTTISTFIR